MIIIAVRPSIIDSSVMQMITCLNFIDDLLIHFVGGFNENIDFETGFIPSFWGFEQNNINPMMIDNIGNKCSYNE